MTLAILDARDREYVVVAAGADLIATYVQQAILAGQTAQEVLDAILAAGLSEGVFASEAAGLSGTTDGQYFWVGDGGAVTLYLNDSGTGDEIAELATVTSVAGKANTADLAAPAGAGMVGFDQNRLTSPTNRTVLSWLQQRPLMLEDAGGGVGKTAAENDAAWALLAAYLAAGLRGGSVEFGPGTYEFSQPLTWPSNAVQASLRGQGPRVTVIKQTNVDNNIIELPNTINHTLTIEGMTLLGVAVSPGYAGTGHGIYNLAGVGNDTFNLKIRDIDISHVGGDAVHLEDAFTVDIYALGVGTVGGHGIYGGGNTWKMDSCYIHNIITPGKAAYRIIGGNATLINCNGIDAGDIWADLGQSTLEGDAINAYPQVVMIGCNQEFYSKVGLNLRNGDVHLFGCTSIAAPSKANVRAYSMRPQQGGILGNIGAIILGGGSSWENGYPIHLKSSPNYGMPFATVYGQGSAGKYTFWNDGGSAAVTAPVEQVYVPNSTARGKSYSHLQALEIMNVGTGGEYRFNNARVVNARKTGWATATGTATRTTFDTATVTLPELAARLKALIDDLHQTAGHGLIGT